MSSFSTPAWLGKGRTTIPVPESGSLSFDDHVLVFTNDSGQVVFRFTIAEIQVTDFRYKGRLFLRLKNGKLYRISSYLEGPRVLPTAEEDTRQMQWREALRPYIPEGKTYNPWPLFILLMTGVAIVMSIVFWLGSLR